MRTNLRSSNDFILGLILSPNRIIKLNVLKILTNPKRGNGKIVHVSRKLTTQNERLFA